MSLYASIHIDTGICLTTSLRPLIRPTLAISKSVSASDICSSIHLNGHLPHYKLTLTNSSDVGHFKIFWCRFTHPLTSTYIHPISNLRRPIHPTLAIPKFLRDVCASIHLDSRPPHYKFAPAEPSDIGRLKVSRRSSRRRLSNDQQSRPSFRKRGAVTATPYISPLN